MRKIRAVEVILGGGLMVCVACIGIFWAISNIGAPSAVATPVALAVEQQALEYEPDIIEIPDEVVHIETEEEIPPQNNPAVITYLPWNLTLVNRYNVLPADFEVYLSYIGNGHWFDARAAESLSAMMESARSQGLAPIVISSHRSIARQTTLFENQLNRQLNAGLSHDAAFDAARRVVAYPGESEHNLGLAVDIVANHYRNLTANFGQTPEGIWLAQNAHRYGFVLRYPYHKQHLTHIIYEPWHFRYVGVEHATTMFELDLVLEEYIELFRLVRQ